MKLSIYLLAAVAVVSATGCKKEGCTDPNALNYSESAKSGGPCSYSTPYVVPSTYSFTNGAGNSTVDYGGQSERVTQLKELMVYVKSGKDGVIVAQSMDDMFANTGGNGGGNFSFTSTKQLKDKCFSLDQTLIENYFDSVALASVSFAATASNGQAGTLTSGASKYLFAASGIEYAQLIEKIAMGAVFEYQALNVYFGDAKMDVDNTTAVDPANGLYYTTMQHHWDEAFGYFSVPVDFPTTPATDFWGKYCNSQDAVLSSNAIMMDNFLKGRAAIDNLKLEDRDVAIANIREMWENIAAYQAMAYLDQAIANFGTDNAKFLHVTSEAYAFIYCLRYAPVETRNMTTQEVADVIAAFGDNFWELTVQDLNAIKASIDAKY
ncbi:MAG: hypothetical protein A3D31_00375 [Candidatus Fluviicola riflensis]|nr:MAG: hypothetical protein CHH17_05170 [Candidatus Fluviicola riflensis]OGS76063.1 MAG: hypothetical protein A3D31_00375 [Candidatus Fluviicola riflensis]OGS81963.1 MAG: hypothetical protein A2724_16130 [Fluviicola sp. RIFCSPHIGHO2_01_FULL_43_53]OGS83401.1 MAG: hypothetical protein A3E30_19295 [Fluviicola sp. RIFCSPHIGHO2_12_FULL_43_24]